MRIAHIINHLGVSGVNQVVADLVSVFNAHGHECVIYYLKHVIAQQVILARLCLWEVQPPSPSTLM